MQFNYLKETTLRGDPRAVTGNFSQFLLKAGSLRTVATYLFECLDQTQTLFFVFFSKFKSSLPHANAVPHRCTQRRA